MVRPRLSRSGVTLAEMLVVSAILGTVILVVTPLMIKAIQFFSLSRARIELQREARDAMNLITRNLREAESNSIRIDQATGQPYYSRITFNKSGSSQNLYYYQSGNKLIQQAGNNQTILSKNLRYLAFSFPRSDDLAIISVSLTMQQTIYEGRVKALHMASEKVEVMN